MIQVQSVSFQQLVSSLLKMLMCQKK